MLAPTTSRVPILVVIAIAVINSLAHGQAVLYDNTDHVWSLPHSGPKNVLWIGTGDAQRYISVQPFSLGGHDNISSVSQPIGIEDSTPKTGSYRITLWDANENGFPGQEIHEFGVVDFAELTVVGDFDGVGPLVDPPVLPLIAFDSPVKGLTPGSTYFLGWDFDNQPNSNHGSVQGLTNSPLGANGAGAAMDYLGNLDVSLVDNVWTPINQTFSHGRHIQMRIVSADDPYQVATSTVGDPYSQSFDQMDANGERGFVPAGWAYYDEIIENVVDDPADDEIIYNTYATHAFPPDSRLRIQSEGPTLFNAGVPGDSDRALTIGTHRLSGESTIQFVTELNGGNAQSLQLAFDVEAWESDRSKDDPGEAAFNVVLDVDTGNGFEQVLDFGKVTTGATLVPAEGDYVNGNEDAYRVAFESEQRNVTIPDGSQIRIRWQADLEAETRGWVYGLDNVALSLFAEPLLGDFDGNGQLTASDIDLLSAEVLAGGDDLTFDTNADGLISISDHQHWVTSSDYAGTFVGDTNLDGTVNFPDFLALSAGFGNAGGWAEGDMDGNGQVEFPDFLALSANFGQSSAAAASVPEPSSLCLLYLALMAIRGIRRSNCR